MREGPCVRAANIFESALIEGLRYDHDSVVKKLNGIFGVDLSQFLTDVLVNSSSGVLGSSTFSDGTNSNFIWQTSTSS